MTGKVALPSDVMAWPSKGALATITAMADPHVQRLLYRFKVTAPNTSYKNPPAVSYENDVFKATWRRIVLCWN